METCAAVGLCEKEMGVRSALRLKFEAESYWTVWNEVFQLGAGRQAVVGIATPYGLLVQDPVL
jgi:hypothetical protein